MSPSWRPFPATGGGGTERVIESMPKMYLAASASRMSLSARTRRLTGPRRQRQHHREERRARVCAVALRPGVAMDPTQAASRANPPKPRFIAETKRAAKRRDVQPARAAHPSLCNRTRIKAEAGCRHLRSLGRLRQIRARAARREVSAVHCRPAWCGRPVHRSAGFDGHRIVKTPVPWPHHRRPVAGSTGTVRRIAEGRV